MVDVYCLKCKGHREVKNGEEVTLKNGRHAIKGKCGDCGSGVYKFVKSN